MEGRQSLSAIDLQRLTYRRVRVKDNTLDDNLLPSRPLSKRKYFILQTPPTTNIGLLSVLPLEILHEVISQLDILSLSHFRRLNRQAFELIGSHPAYRVIAKYARNALCGILAVKTGKWITCDTLYQILCTSKCEQCGDFGGYLYLITCRRVCFLCFTSNRAYLPMRLDHASWKFGLHHRVIKDLPCVKIVYGRYSPDQRRPIHSVLVDYESARDAGIAKHGSVEAMNSYVSDLAAQKDQVFIDAKRKAEGDSDAELRITRKHCTWRNRLTTWDLTDRKVGEPFRYVAIVRVPYFDRALRQPEWGFHCFGCRDLRRDRQFHFRRKFTAASFQEHLDRCGDIVGGEHRLVKSRNDIINVFRPYGPHSTNHFDDT
ncbi:hypothetical protein F5B22DRAFT_471880 [Xylaria bambusicola]|uniref:uncharacterized protein n=1 Tax=Xylaria bambusicola TaxID=326684 RepID=UPI0020078095|nr:uncharacterized protein F5B22DRAFT_471880 [Xylaria bambusicola]KAI0506230.1 hypothetical protein F5B22DRAFT_471880 [Xylaria bambusicola]